MVGVETCSLGIAPLYKSQKELTLYVENTAFFCG